VPVRKGGYEGYELEDISLAESGAVVVLDVNSGDVLSIASYPSFDLNLFTGGISDENYEALTADKDMAILYNKAVSSRGTPGSIFKMVTGLAALMEGEKNTDKGTTLYEEIDCKGKFDVDVLYGEAPGCWQPDISKHQDQTIVEGLEHSCNYYFFTLAKRLGIDLLDKWGDKFGLTAPTGIELPGEAIGQIGNQAILFNPDEDLDHQSTWIPKLVKNGTYGIVSLLDNYATENNIEYDDGVIDKTATELIYLMGSIWEENDDGYLANAGGKTLGESIREILAKNMRITNRLAKSSGLSDKISDMLSQLRWGPIDTIQTGIGQGYVQVTPIAVARYIAAIANGGTVYETHLVDKVIAQDGTVVYDKEPVIYDTLDAKSEYIDAIKEGMRSVVSEEEGTASDAFTNFPDEYLEQLGGKTGSAEVTKDIDLENNSWFVCFAPFEKPEIAVVVYVPHGCAGSWSICIAQDILMYYFDGKKKVAEQTIPAANTLVVPGYAPEATTTPDTDTPEEE
jgi:penicillin-binding protein 2